MLPTYSTVQVSLALVAEMIAGLYRLAETLPTGKVNEPLNVLSIGPDTKLVALPAVDEAAVLNTKGFAAVVIILPFVRVRRLVTVVEAFNVTLLADFETLRL